MITYNKIVESCFFHPVHAGSLDISLPNTALTHAGKQGQGGYFDLYLCCDGQGQVVQAKYRAYGNPYLLAGLELLCRQLEGKNIQTLPSFGIEEFKTQLDLPKNQQHLALLVEEGYCNIIKLMREKLQVKQ